MAKRELSSTLKNLKFMQRAAQREEKIEKEEEVVIAPPDGNFSASCIVKKCIVIMEGDPHPGLTKGRMSFQNFNPTVDKLNGQTNGPSQPEASSTCADNQNGEFVAREDESTQDGFENSNLNKSSNTLTKRKQPEVASETSYPNESPLNGQSGLGSQKAGKKFDRQQKREKLDWAVLRPPKGKKKSD